MEVLQIIWYSVGTVSFWHDNMWRVPPYEIWTCLFYCDRETSIAGFRRLLEGDGFCTQVSGEFRYWELEMPWSLSPFCFYRYTRIYKICWSKSQGKYMRSILRMQKQQTKPPQTSSQNTNTQSINKNNKHNRHAKHIKYVG